MADPPAANDGIVGRVRGASLSIMNANPQLGMWQAAGTAIAQAPNLTELRDENSGGDNIAFNSQGHSARFARQERDGELALVRSSTRNGSIATEGQPAFRSVFKDSDKPDERHEGEPDEARVLMGDDQANGSPDPRQQFQRRQSLYEKHMAKEKAPWQTTVVNGLKAFWKFFLTPSGFIITIYCLNIVAWGAMLFFLLINAAPAMNYPSADDNNSPRKKWLEIDSQILNALFCVTGFGLAPWRFRDLYWFIRATNFKDREAMRRLAAQNKGWFRPPAWTFEDEKGRTPTFTNQTAPPTALWKLGFTIWMMVLNTLLQAVLCYFMWGYNRIDRPSWATGTFIGLGCGVAMMAGVMSWWEGRKVKKIEGPQVEVVEEV
ncbi:hypothetical protein COL154_009105 [Colletotrichum chrysophilum]|uniref:Uncharacterized protein n=1 Tax=Colletotrichum chrysophilum TaxID=1836956 RepID=A0AAD9AMT3_9PEZI|nr:uncharacterized protein COL26b_011264 [Colletotrichum chrysophilum]KAF4874154.1 hypothetical protein CGCSCA1_v006641 [Colletotrichum siamense]KAJ0343544.1 hypothetical protein KNSL1_010221 [Colletotrichum chrysophilum]KAJ0358480.1 hypothetical protein COL154_009105 [Colletotrichum chrysophilum]KAJ0367424.1 hypothetical protein COL26b_011264 [Colletotrichum chrysophilum]KAK1851081.1 hypothetical protein CCHR01_06309 [Colletotrichum chrysophilum]